MRVKDCQLTDLPKEVAELVALYLSPIDAVKMTRVNRKCRMHLFEAVIYMNSFAVKHLYFYFATYKDPQQDLIPAAQMPKYYYQPWLNHESCQNWWAQLPVVYWAAWFQLGNVSSKTLSAISKTSIPTTLENPPQAADAVSSLRRVRDKLKHALIMAIMSSSTSLVSSKVEDVWKASLGPLHVLALLDEPELLQEALIIAYSKGHPIPLNALAYCACIGDSVNTMRWFVETQELQTSATSAEAAVLLEQFMVAHETNRLSSSPENSPPTPPQLRWIHFRNGQQNKMMQYSARYGAIKTLQYLYEVYPTLNLAENESQAFRKACKYGHLEVAEYLITHPMCRSNPTANDSVAFKDACAYGHVDIVRLLLEKSNVDVCVGQHVGLKLACGNGKLEVVKLLAGVHKNPVGECSKKGHLDIPLSTTGAGVMEHPCRGGLVAAGTNGHLEVIKWLLYHWCGAVGRQAEEMQSEGRSIAIQAASRSAHYRVAEGIRDAVTVGPDR